MELSNVILEMSSAPDILLQVHAKIPCPLCDLQFEEVTDLQRHLTFHAEQPRDASSRESTVLLSPLGNLISGFLLSSYLSRRGRTM